MGQVTRQSAQKGVFVHVDPHESGESGLRDVQDILRHYPSIKVTLKKHLIPKSDALAALDALNERNINFTTLFPDTEGAARHANLQIATSQYPQLKMFMKYVEENPMT